MYKQLVDKLRPAIDATLDFIWDATLPLSTKCPVCAFWRGVGIGVIVGWLFR